MVGSNDDRYQEEFRIFSGQDWVQKGAVMTVTQLLYPLWYQS